MNISLDATKLAQLENKLGYIFKDNTLLRQALTHRSASTNHNERLEFFGDAILSFVVADYLYHQLSKIDEGQLSRMRAHLVKGDTLADIGRQLNLSDALNMGQGEQRTGGNKRRSIISDAVEAIIAAVYLDGGLSAAHALIHRLLADHLSNPIKALQAKDPKSYLQERLQAMGLPLPVYAIQQTQGLQHKQVFTVTCRIPNASICTTGVGTNRRSAEQQAAQAALQQMTNL